MAIGALPTMLDIFLPPCPGTDTQAEARGLSGYPCTRSFVNAGRTLHLLQNKEDLAKNAANAAEEASPTKGVDFAAMASMANKNDCYQMLGLQDLRWRATQQDIKKAYRQCVLKYHPDKMSQNATENDDEEGKAEEGKGETEDVSDIPKPVRAVIEKMLEQGKSDAAILSNYQMEEFIQGNDVCPKGLENPEEKVARMRRVKEGKSGKETEADQDFKALSNAMSILSDVMKRKAYDSSDVGAEIDDSLPADKKPKSDEEFFTTWAPVFERNARWSTTSMPKMGNMDTPIEQVLEMYDAWFNMESWRDFTMECDDAFDLEEASCREERRWMERQNKKMGEKMKKDEKNRINMMIETAHKWDPRIINYRENLKNAKKAAKQARFADVRKAQEDMQRKAEEEAAAKKKAEEEEAVRKKAEKEVKEAAKKQLRKAKKGLRDAAEPLSLDDAVQAKVAAICEACTITGEGGVTMEQVVELSEKLAALSTDDGKGGADDLIRQLAGAIKEEGTPEGSAAAPLPPPPVAVASAPKKEKDRKWSRDEMDQLHKALLRFPAGTQERWHKIAEHVGSRNDGECQRKCAEMKNNFAATATGMHADQSTEFQRSRAEAAKGHGSRSGTGKRMGGTSVVAEREAGRDQEAPAEAPAATTDAGAKEEKKEEKDEWTVEQQRALEAAMQELKSSTLDAKEKWKAIAEKVPGRTDKECIRRVKEIKAMLAAKGSA